MTKKEFLAKYKQEFLEFCEYNNITGKDILIAYKLNRQFPEWCTPCEDCDTLHCTQNFGKVFWCPDRM